MKHILYTQTHTAELRPEKFWRWLVIVSICTCIMVICFGFLFFRATEAILATPIVVQKKNTEQQVAHIEKRIDNIESAVRVRTGTPATLPTSQN